MPTTQMKLELAERLDRLDPGNSLSIDATVLEETFGLGKPIELVIQAVEEFAEQHQCTFSYRGEAGNLPAFTKDDVF
jgi:hypothetical protein